MTTPAWNYKDYQFDFSDCSISDMDMVIQDELTRVLNREPTREEVLAIWSEYRSLALNELSKDVAELSIRVDNSIKTCDDFITRIKEDQQHEQEKCISYVP